MQLVLGDGVDCVSMSMKARDWGSAVGVGLVEVVAVQGKEGCSVMLLEGFGADGMVTSRLVLYIE